MTQPHDSIALVIGAGSGIGRATAKVLVADGWRVLLSGRRVAALQESIALCGDPYGDIQARALAVPADITRPDAVAALFDVVRARFGRLDLLLNSAGIAMPAVPLENLSLEQWRAAVDTHLTGAFLCTQEAFRIMKSQSPRGGRILNKGATPAQAPGAQNGLQSGLQSRLQGGLQGGSQAGPQDVAQGATHHAMRGLTEACALQGRTHDIAVGQIDLGSARVDVHDVARAVLHIAKLPLQTNVLFMAVAAR